LDYELTIKGGVEVVSRVLDSSNLGWIEEVNNVWSAISNHFIVRYDKSCSTHVHVKQSTGYSTPDLRKIAKGVAYWEPSVKYYIPPERCGNTCATSNITGAVDPETECLKDFYSKYQGEGFAKLFNEIANCEATQEKWNNKAKSRFMGPARNLAWNFTNIWMKNHTENSRDPIGTIEFRRPPQSLSSAAVRHWITFALSFIHASTAKDIADVPIIANSKIPSVGGLDGWGKEKASDFAIWLSNSANVLGLAGHLDLSTFQMDASLF